MKVYIVLQGERAEGGTVVAVCDSLEKAEKKREELEAVDWFIPSIDYVEVEEWEVQ